MICLSKSLTPGRRVGAVSALLCLIVLAGCSPSEFETPTPPPTWPPSATETPTAISTSTPSPTTTPLPPSETPYFTPTASLMPPATDTPTPTLALTLALSPFTPAPGQIAFTSEQNGSSDIYIINSDGSGLKQLTNNGNYSSDAAWSPDGNRLAFTSTSIDANGTIVASEIYQINADGSGQVSLTADLREHGIAAFDSAWSPDGRWLAFDGRDASQLGQGFNTSQVYILDTQTLAVRDITQWPTSSVGCDLPQWHPDGYHLVIYCRNLMQGGLNLLDTRDESLTAVVDWQGAWPFAISPDGGSIAFYYDYGVGVTGEFVGVTSENGHASVDWSSVYLSVTQPPEATNYIDIQGFAWSPVQNDQIAVVADTGLYLFHLIAEKWEPQELLGQVYLDEHSGGSLGWSPDGTNIVFPSTIDGHDDLFITPLDGSGLINLTQSDADESQPVWRP